jgi:hypothetical protein
MSCSAAAADDDEYHIQTNGITFIDIKYHYVT